MKEIIEIPVGNYEYCQKLVKDKQGNFFDIAVAGGIKLDDLTNGEVIKKMFPHYDIEIDEHKGYVRVFYENFYTTYPLAWWNRKWGE